MNYTVIGVDLAKRVFQLHWMETETGEICRLQIKRNQLSLLQNEQSLRLFMSRIIDL